MLFLFGTLLHPPLLEAVTGRPDAAASLRPASLSGHRIAAVRGAADPVLVPDPAACAEGALYPVPDADTWARLDGYEAVFGHARAAITIDTPDGPVQAWLYRSDTARAAAGDWSLADWAARFGASVTAAATEVLDLLRSHPPEALAPLYPQILQRGDSRARARAGHPLTGAPEGVHLHARRRPYVNFFAVEEYDIAFRRYDGALSPVAERAIFIAGDVAIVLPYDPVRDQVLLIEQFRVGAFGRGDPECWITEPVAGRIDPGESAEDAARREAAEEAGLTLTGLIPVATGYPSPGTTTEFFNIFIGLCDLSGIRTPAMAGSITRSKISAHAASPGHNSTAGWPQAPIV